MMKNSKIMAFPQTFLSAVLEEISKEKWEL
jgi:hypothetical protein